MSNITSFDLRNLNLEPGTYSITVRAKAPYWGSAVSNKVIYKIYVEFTIYHEEDDFNSYRSPSDMTWGEWCGSSYDTSQWYRVDSEGYVVYDNENQRIKDSNGNYVKGVDTIKHQGSYYHTSFSFKIQNQIYYGGPGMTWIDWCDSGYNTLGCTVESNNTIDCGNQKVCTVFAPVAASDVIVDGGEYWLASPDIYTFQIEGTSYQCEKDMTWGEWIASKYCRISSSFTVWDSTEGYQILVYGGDAIINPYGERYYVTKDTIIEDDGQYPLDSQWS